MRERNNMRIFIILSITLGIILNLVALMVLDDVTFLITTYGLLGLLIVYKKINY